MDYPSTTRDDVEQNAHVDVLVRVESIDDSPGGPVDWQATVTDRTGKQFALSVFEGDDGNYDLHADTWYVLRNASGNVYNGTPELRSNFGKMSVEQVPPPSPDVAPILESAASDSDAPAGGVVALDVEVLTPVSEAELDLQDPEHVELLCVALGYRPEQGLPAETTVLFREDASDEAELALVESVCEWIERRDPDVLVTYAGEDFDVEHLRMRPLLAGSGADWFGDLLGTLEYHDIDRGRPLEEAAEVEPTYWDIYRHSLDPSDWREAQGKSGSELRDPELDSGDVPYVGERYLELRSEVDEHDPGKREYRALCEMLRRYAVADVEPLFDLYDSDS